MKKLSLLLFVSLFLPIAVLNTNCSKSNSFKHFVTCSGNNLMDGKKELRFISFNIPNLLLIEDNMKFEETNPWRLPNEFEIRDALKAIQQIGGQVVRTYAFSVRRADDRPEFPRHVLGVGKFNQDAFQTLDKILQVANEYGIRVIIPFVDNWSWMGGRAEYAGFRGKNKDDFWTNPQIIADFKRTINFVINRTNTVTGIQYKNDKAILAWETGNELQCPFSWTKEIAAYIKSIDSNHLLIDGFQTTVLREESLQDDNIDIVTTHHYEKNPDDMVKHILQSAKIARGKKPYIVGEFGFIPMDGVKKVVNTVVTNHISGALAWSLRFRNRDGGFYWHSEPYGGDLFKAYLWPGFPTGDSYNETDFFKFMREKAFTVQGKTVPLLPIPDPPTLLPIKDISKITWRGSVGAASYIVERAETKKGPRQIVVENVIETNSQYKPLFNDNQAEIGKEYFYRIKAQNESGISEPSNSIGPVMVEHLTLVDEMRDFSLIFHRHGDLSVDNKFARRAKEDMHRLKGNKGSFVVYHLPGVIKSGTIYTFFPHEIKNFKFFLSTDGANFSEISSEKRSYLTGTNDYGYWKPVKYEFKTTANEMFIKIEFTTDAQISSVEINYTNE